MSAGRPDGGEPVWFEAFLLLAGPTAVLLMLVAGLCGWLS